MASSRGKARAVTTDLAKMTQNHVEERNRLIFGLSGKDAVQIRELMSWSLEALYQMVWMNHLDARKSEAKEKNIKRSITFK